MTLRTLLIQLSLVLVIIGCAWGRPLAPGPAAAPVRMDGLVDFLLPDGSLIVTIGVEIAATPASLAKGLMFRALADFNSGMLLVFPHADRQHLWMRNTPAALDLIFVAEDGQVLNIVPRARPLSDRTYASEGPARYAVEVRGGFAERHALTRGVRMRWHRLQNGQQ